MSKEYILTIVEGEKVEKQILDNIDKLYFSMENKNVKILPYCNNIYNLYKKLQKDDDLDIVGIVKEELNNKNYRNKVYQESLDIINNVYNDNISEIYLFFDYDKHDTNSDDNIIKEMLSFFDNETEKGKLYISYPMVEALKHIKKEKMEECIYINPTKDGKNYKKIVSKNSNYNRIDQLNKKDWNKISLFNIVKLENNLFDNNINLLNKSVYNKHINQIKIFNKQIKKNKEEEKIVILSAFPLFLIEYFKSEFYDKIKECSLRTCTNKLDTKVKN